MDEATIICIPSPEHKKLTIKRAAKSYTNMTITEYDRLVSFSPKYDSIKKVPDHIIENFREKEGRLIDLTIFASQPMIKVGNTLGNFTSSSYLLNPHDSDLNKADLYLPDLDIIEISGETQVKDAINKIQRFYQKHGWQITTVDTILKDKQSIVAPEERNWENLQITNPESLMQLVLEETSYDPTKLYFNND